MFSHLRHAFRVAEHYYRENTKGRMPFWPDCQRDFLEAHPRCAACGSTRHLAVHHVEPFFLEPSKEVDWTNLIVLCCECHFELGHGADWNSFNPHIRKDAEIVLKQPALRPQVEAQARSRRLCRDPLA